MKIKSLFVATDAAKRVTSLADARNQEGERRATQ